MHIDLTLLPDYLPLPLWVKSTQGQLLYINKAFEDTFTIKKATIISRNLIDLITIYSEDPLLNKLFTYIHQFNNPIDTFIFLSHKTFKPSIMSYPSQNEECILGTLSPVVTECSSTLDTRHKLLETVIDNIPELIFYKDVHGFYQGANKPCRLFYKERGISHVIGKRDMDLDLDKNFLTQCVQHDHCVLDSKKTLIIEEEILNKDGSTTIFETIKTPLFNDRQTILGIVGVVRDITRKKQFENKLWYLSYTDILSGLYNRAYFNEMVPKLMEQSAFPLGLILGDLNGLKIINDTLGHLQGDKLIEETAKLLQMICPEKALIFRWGGDEFVILLPYSSIEECESLMEEIMSACENSHYDNFKLSLSLGTSLISNKGECLDKALQDAEDKLYRQKMLSQKSLRSSILSTLQETLATKNVETQAHTERVLNYSLKIGKALNLDHATLDELALVAKLHDIGKIGISESILLKPSHLTLEEFEIMKTHAEKGYRLAMLFPELSHIARGILTHHEYWDGTGYPLGLKGEEIPLIARIVAVVDAFDSMTKNGVYSCLKSFSNALKELKSCRGTQFDPSIVDIFSQILENTK